jgi:hypothetical protein
MSRSHKLITLDQVNSNIHLPLNQKILKYQTRPWEIKLNQTFMIEFGSCCDVAVAQINYPSLKHNTQDSI